MRKTLFVMFSVVLMVFAFVACEGEPTTIPEEQIEANNLAESYISSVKYLSVLNEAFAVEDETISVTSSSAGSVVVTFNNYTGDAVAKTGDIEGIVSGELTYTFSEASTSARALSDMDYKIETTKSLVFNLKDGSKAEDTIDFEINGSCRIDLIVTGNASTGIGAGSSIGAINEATITVGKGDTAITVDISDIEVDIEDSIKDDTPEERQEIATESALRTAASTGSGTYYVIKNIELTGSELEIIAPITLIGDGTGITISRDTSELANDTATSNSVILIKSNDVVLRNLTVDGKQDDSSADWVDGVWGIKVYNATGVTLEDITVSNINAGIQVNSSTVTVDGTITVSDCHWGGIGVDQSKDQQLHVGALTLASGVDIVSTNETKPAIWLESEDKADITGADSMVHFDCTDPEKAGQVWYITSEQEGKAVDQRYIDSEEELINAVKVSGVYFLNADITLDEALTIAIPLTLSSNDTTHTITLKNFDTSNPESGCGVRINANDVKLDGVVISASNDTISAQSTDLENVHLLLATGADNLFLNNVTLNTNSIVSGLNIYECDNAKIEGLKVTGSSIKSPISITESVVSFGENISLEQGKWAYLVQVNGVSSSDDSISKSTITLSDDSIGSFWVEAIGGKSPETDNGEQSVILGAEWSKYTGDGADLNNFITNLSTPYGVIKIDINGGTAEQPNGWLYATKEALSVIFKDSLNIV